MNNTSKQSRKSTLTVTNVRTENGFLYGTSKKHGRMVYVKSDLGAALSGWIPCPKR